MFKLMIGNADRSQSVVFMVHDSVDELLACANSLMNISNVSEWVYADHAVFAWCNQFGTHLWIQ